MDDYDWGDGGMPPCRDDDPLYDDDVILWGLDPEMADRRRASDEWLRDEWVLDECLPDECGLEENIP